MISLLVLDLDSTLIDSHDATLPEYKTEHPKHEKVFGFFHVYERPFLDEYLDFVFSKFTYVALWSSAKKIWVDKIVRTIPSLKKYQDKFLFIWSRERSSHLGQDAIKSTKPLKKIWRQSKYKKMGINSSNTLIMDDIPTNYRLNRGNGVFIKPFEYQHDDIIRDNGIWYGFYNLESQIEKLKMLIEKYKVTKNVRVIDIK